MSFTYIYLPGKDDTKIWGVLTKIVSKDTWYIKYKEDSEIKNTQMREIIKSY